MSAERLADVARRLDELSEELPELLALAEELQGIAEAWPETRVEVKRDQDLTELLGAVEHFIARKADRDPEWLERLVFRHRRDRLDTHAHYWIKDLPVMTDPSALFKGLTP